MAAPVDTTTESLARLAELNDEELQSLREQLIRDFHTADEADDADIDHLTSLADQLTKVQGRMAERAAEPADPPAAQEPEAPAESAAEVPAEPEAPAADTAPEVTAETSTPAQVVEAPTPAVETAPETPVQEGSTPVAAAAGTEVSVPQGAEPIIASGPTPRVYVAGGVPGFAAGAELESTSQLNEALAARINTLLRLNGGDGEQVVIASIKNDADDSRTLDKHDAWANMERIEAVTSPDAMVANSPGTALVASGGCCAPLVTKYDLWDDGGSTARPVRDSLAGFRADRGGIRFYPNPPLADVQGALGFWTCADDAAADPANTSTWKVCARINCPAEQTAELQAITMCLTFGVLQTRIFPEVAAANTKLLGVAQARLADSALLAQIKAGSVAVTDSGTAWGAVRDLMNTVGRASMYYRDRYRLTSAPLRAILPSWILEVMRTDLLDGPDWGRPWGTHFGVSEDEMRTFFSNRNINVTFALDSYDPASNGGGFFNAISGAALPAFPTSVQWALYPEGAWLFLDGGQLDLGVIRDSQLVRVNDYMQFSETFEAAAHIGGESLWITSTINVSGAYPAGI